MSKAYLTVAGVGGNGRSGGSELRTRLRRVQGLVGPQGHRQRRADAITSARDQGG